MIECGYNLRLSNPKLIMRGVMNSEWKADDYMFALYLINHGAVVNSLPLTRRGKENIRRLLRRDSERKFKFPRVFNTDFCAISDQCAKWWTYPRLPKSFC